MRFRTGPSDLDAMAKLYVRLLVTGSGRARPGGLVRAGSSGLVVWRRVR
ncbi:hypothetical protein ACTWPT_50155 [Nonomuraea sp. 3N208]